MPNKNGKNEIEKTHTFAVLVENKFGQSGGGGEFAAQIGEIPLAFAQAPDDALHVCDEIVFFLGVESGKNRKALYAEAKSDNKADGKK